MKTKVVILSTILAGGVLAGSLGLAQASPYRFCLKDRQHADYSQHRHAGKSMHGMLVALDLEPAQRDKIKAIMQENRDQLKDQRQAMRELRQQMHQSISSEDYDETKVQQLAREKARLSGEMSVQRIVMLRQIYQQLTPEQQETFRSLRQRDHHDQS